MALFHPTKKLFFIHVPKTGGSSIQDLAQRRSSGWIVVGKKHESFLEVSLEYPEELLKKIRECYKFHFIRNPYSHAVSRFFHHIANFRFYIENVLRIPYEERLSETIRKEKFTFERFIKEYYVLENSSSQNAYLQTGAIKPDDVFKFEELSERWKELGYRFKLKYKILPKTNQSDKIENVLDLKYNHYRSFYTDELKRIVGEHSKEIIQRFGYEF